MTVRRIDDLSANGNDLDEAALRVLYAYPEPLTTPWIRVNFVSSVDGAMTDGSTVGALATPSDKTVFTVLRHLADAILVGAGTVRAENYGGAGGDARVRSWRTARGLAAVPPVVIVSATARIEPTARVVAGASRKPIVITSSVAESDRIAGLRDAGVEVVRCAGDTIGGTDIRAVLAERGMMRVLCEGGPALLGQLLDDDVVDELCLTTAPVAVGGPAGRIARGPDAVRRPMRPAHILYDSEDATVLTRWVRDRASDR
ncbi:pyrimidine reductase family protein [Nocardia takedensis]